MLTKLAVAILLVLGTAQAAESIKPTRGETTASYQCRAAFIPEARQCVQRCDASASGDDRWECVHACTTRGLWSMAQCREAGAPVATSFATR